MGDRTDYQTMLSQAPAHWGLRYTSTIHSSPSLTIDPSRVSLPDGYTVVVTGAGQGIGEFIAKAYALAKASNIIITSRTSSNLERVKRELDEVASQNKHQVNVKIVAGDATDPESYAKIRGVIAEKLNGRLDCLVCNAGGAADMAGFRASKFADTDAAEYEYNTRLNYLGPYFAARELIPVLLESNGGKTLIDITSAACHFVSVPILPYNIAKLALNRLVECIDATHQGDGLVAVALHPGGVMTPTSFEKAPEAAAGISVEAIISTKNRIDLIPVVLKDDIRLCGAVCVWLSRERPEWLSGRYISATWDMEELKAKKDEIVHGDKLKFRMVV